MTALCQQDFRKGELFFLKLNNEYRILNVEHRSLIYFIIRYSKFGVRYYFNNYSPIKYSVSDLKSSNFTS
jgi:hypothetical protein